MATPAHTVAYIAALLGLLGLFRWWRLGFKRFQYPMWYFVAMVAFVWGIILLVAWFTGGPAEFNRFWPLCKAYAIGMLVMYIATKAYKS
jgi:hypothetical protein